MPRATPLHPDQRRRSILEATRSLILNRGVEVTTREIAGAAGIAEGTIFRVFDTKQDLITEAIEEALDHDSAIAELDTIPAGLSLDARVTTMVSILLTEISRIRPLWLLHSQRREGRRPPARCPINPVERRDRFITAVAEALTPVAGELAVPPRVAAQVLMALTFSTTHDVTGDDSLTQPDHLARIALGGLARGDL